MYIGYWMNGFANSLVCLNLLSTFSDTSHQIYLQSSPVSFHFLPRTHCAVCKQACHYGLLCASHCQLFPWIPFSGLNFIHTTSPCKYRTADKHTNITHPSCTRTNAKFSLSSPFMCTETLASLKTSFLHVNYLHNISSGNPFFSTWP